MVSPLKQELCARQVAAMEAVRDVHTAIVRTAGPSQPGSALLGIPCDLSFCIGSVTRSLHYSEGWSKKRESWSFAMGFPEGWCSLSEAQQWEGSRLS